MKFYLSPRAEEDRDAIIDYTYEHFGFQQAYALAENFESALHRLGDNPRIGHFREDLSPPNSNLRYWTVKGRFMIVYRPEQQPVEILRILDGARDVRGILSEQV